jgi:hypothetical protein
LQIDEDEGGGHNVSVGLVAGLGAGESNV